MSREKNNRKNLRAERDRHHTVRSFEAESISSNFFPPIAVLVFVSFFPQAMAIKKNKSKSKCQMPNTKCQSSPMFHCVLPFHFPLLPLLDMTASHLFLYPMRERENSGEKRKNGKKTMERFTCHPNVHLLCRSPTRTTECRSAKHRSRGGEADDQVLRPQSLFLFFFPFFLHSLLLPHLFYFSLSFSHSFAHRLTYIRLCPSPFPRLPLTPGREKRNKTTEDGRCSFVSKSMCKE